MINYKELIAEKLDGEIEGLDKSEIMELIETPPDQTLGDYAFPCFSLAKTLRKNPAIIASELSENLKDEKYFAKVESNSAYVNFFANKVFFIEEVLKEVKDKKEDYGKSDIGHGKKVCVEFSSPNIAKPFHIGHIRSTVIGDSLKRIFDFLGYDTVSINHLGDYGTQFGMMITAYKRWGDKEVIESNPIPELVKLYVRINEESIEEPELKDESRMWFKKLEEGDEEAQSLWKWFRDVSLDEFSRVYKMLNIDFDSFRGESFYSDKMPAVIETLKDKKLLQESNGAMMVDLEEYKLPPAMVVKSDGSTIYLTRDIAAAIFRKDTYDFYKSIYVVGSQQNLHFNQLIALLDKMGYPWAYDCIHVAFGMISLEEGTLSTRRGNVVYLEDVLNRAIEKVTEILDQREEIRGEVLENKDKLAKQVGIGAVKFQELFNQRIKDYVFDWDKTLSFDGESGPYVQYTHARICSLLERGNFNVEDEVDFSKLKSEEEFNIAKLIYNFTGEVVEAHYKYEPYLVTRHIVELAKAFNKFYNASQIITEDEELKKARLMLAYGVKVLIKSGLGLLGIEVPTKM